MTLPDDRLNAILDSLYAEVPGRARLLEQHIEALTDEIGRTRAAPKRLLHADTLGYIVVGDGMDVWSDVHPDLASAEQACTELALARDGISRVVHAVVPLELFADPAFIREPPCTHRRLRQITRELLQCEDCGAELDT